MSLSNTILGVLNLSAMTGYDLKKFIDHSTQFFWHAELSQIYPLLKQLETSGKVKVEVIPVEGKPDKKVYSITEKGRAEFLVWLSEPMDETPPTKSPMLLKIFFLQALDKNEVLAQLRCQLEAQRARLKRLQLETSRTIEESAGRTSFATQGVLWELVRQYGELQTQTSITWLEQALKVVEEKL